MYRKVCPKCNGNSFSAASFGKWICPYCHTDLTHEPNRNAETGEEISDEEV